MNGDTFLHNDFFSDIGTDILFLVISQTQEQLTLLIGDAAAEQVVAEVLLG